MLHAIVGCEERIVPCRVGAVTRSMPVERTTFGRWGWDGAAMGVDQGLSRAQLEFYDSEGGVAAFLTTDAGSEFSFGAELN